MVQELSRQQLSAHTGLLLLLLQQGGALAPVLWAIHGGALLLGFGVVACAAMSGMAAVTIVATMRKVASIMKMVLFMLFTSSLFVEEQ